MRWTYDTDSGAFYLYLSGVPVARQHELPDGTVVDLDADDMPVGIELVPLTPPPDFAALARLGVSRAALDVLIFATQVTMPRVAGGVFHPYDEMSRDQADQTVGTEMQVA